MLTYYCTSDCAPQNTTISTVMSYVPDYSTIIESPIYSTLPPLYYHDPSSTYTAFCLCPSTLIHLPPYACPPTTNPLTHILVYAIYHMYLSPAPIHLHLPHSTPTLHPCCISLFDVSHLVPKSVMCYPTQSLVSLSPSHAHVNLFHNTSLQAPPPPQKPPSPPPPKIYKSTPPLAKSFPPPAPLILTSATSPPPHQCDHTLCLSTHY